MTDGSTFFVPWLRRGAAIQVTAGPTTGRAVVEARVDLAGTGASPLTATRTIELKGPEDIVGFDPRAIVRVWPPPNTFDAEPNLFPLMELAAPDLPWRYSPVPASGARVHPWLTLVVARDGGESSEIADRRVPSRTQPLPSALFAASALPNLAQASAWAHVQVLGTEAEAPTLARQDPSRVVARLLCPRKLEARTTYVAALVPTYARSREAGLGLARGTGSAVELAWDGAERELPIYYEWRFGTGDLADFEQLARKLTARPLPASVGVRAMDVSGAGAGLPAATPSPASLTGALQPLDAPAVTTPGSGAFVIELTSLLNRPADLLAGTGEMVITPPLYGRWYAEKDRSGVGGNPMWFETLNLDPRWRVAAGLGTLAVQKDDRALLAAAWASVPQLRIANAVLLQATLARAGALRLHARHFAAARTLPQGASERVLQLASGALPRVRTGSTTVFASLRDSAVGPDIFDRSWRLLVRPRSPLARKQLRGNVVYESISSRLNRFAVRAAYPPGLPDGVESAVSMGNRLAPGSPRGANMPAYAELSRDTPVVPMLLLVASLLPSDGKSYYDDPPWSDVLYDAKKNGIPPSASDAKDIVYGIPQWSKFTPVEYSGPNSLSATVGSGSLDSEFRAAAEQLITGLNGRPKTETRPPSVDLDALRETVLAALDPNQTIPAGALPCVSVAAGLDWAPSDPIEPILVRPSYERPMYEPLRALGHEWLLPGLQDVEPDTVTLVKTNQAFVEAYMLGVNQEVNRELLWNEYPTDQRHTFFRQFWDTAGFAAPVETPIDPDELRDIRRIHEWGGQLGTHSSRGGLSEQVVLLLRSELLRRYPSALVYACRAHPSMGPTTDDEEVHPVFSGSLPPDVTFLGFPLTTTELESTDSDGRIWYFVIQEQPTEPKFGLDRSSSGTPSSWDDLSWENLPSETNYVDLAGTLTPAFPFTPDWGWAATDSAKIAWITYQKPVRFATPATNFLGDL